jgi:hypothetical protein
MRVLAGRKERVITGGAVVFADRGTRLHRVGHEPVVYKVELDDPRRLGKSSIDRGQVAQMPVVAEIARRFGEDLRCARRQRFGRVDDGGLLDIIDAQLFGGLAGLSQGFGDDHRDRVADVPHAVAGERRVRWLSHRRAVFRMDLPATGQPADAVGRHVAAGIDCRHSRG